MDNASKSGIRDLLFHVVPHTDEETTDDVLERTEAVDYEEGKKLEAEFRAIFEEMDEYPGMCKIVLESLESIRAAANEVCGHDTEFLHTCDVMGRRIHKALKTIL